MDKFMYLNLSPMLQMTIQVVGKLDEKSNSLPLFIFMRWRRISMPHIHLNERSKWWYMKWWRSYPPLIYTFIFIFNFQFVSYFLKFCKKNKNKKILFIIFISNFHNFLYKILKIRKLTKKGKLKQKQILKFQYYCQCIKPSMLLLSPQPTKWQISCSSHLNISRQHLLLLLAIGFACPFLAIIFIVNFCL